MKDLKLELFNFRKNLSIDQDEVSVIIESHINACKDLSEKDIISSLNEKLKIYTFDNGVKKFLESLNGDLSQYKLIYELKHLYNVLNQCSSSDN
jgi:hypothetical protein